MSDAPELKIATPGGRKVWVPKYVASKAFIMAAIASHWFAAAAILMFIFRPAALVCCLIALTASAATAWFCYIEKQESLMFQEIRRG